MRPSLFRRKSERVCRALLPAVLLVPLAVSSGFAQSVDIPTILDPDVKAPPTFVQLQYGHQFKTEVDDDGTDYARHNAIFGVGHRARLGEKTTLFTLGSYTLHGYDFSGGTGPGNFYRWDEVHRLVIGGLIGYDVNDRWRLLGGGVYRSWGETGADYADSITGGLILGFSYQRSDDFSAGLLLGVFSALEDSIGILPVPTLKWQFAERWRFNIGMVSVFDPGVGTELRWNVSDEWAVGAGAAFQNRRYRLRDRTRVAHPNRPGRTDDGGVGQETEVPIFAVVSWRPTQKTLIDVMGGVAVAGNLRVESDTGGRIKDHDYDPTPFLGIRGQIFF